MKVDLRITLVLYILRVCFIDEHGFIILNRKNHRLFNFLLTIR